MRKVKKPEESDEEKLDKLDRRWKIGVVLILLVIPALLLFYEAYRTRGW